MFSAQRAHPGRAPGQRGLGGLVLTALMMAAIGLPAAGWAMEWDLEYVDAGWLYLESGLGLALDSHGRPHIVHSMYSDELLHYWVRQDDGTWLLDYPTQEHWAGTGVNIALGPDDTPWIAYGAYVSGFVDPVHVAHPQDGQWLIEPLNDGMYWISNCVVAIDAAGTPQVAYGNSAGTLRHATRGGGTWQVQDADTVLGSGFDLDMALDSHGYAHISHWQLGYEGVGYAEACTWWDGARWTQRVLDETVGGWNCIHSGIAIDAQDRPHIVWETHKIHDVLALRYATLTDDGWQVTTIADDIGESSAACSVALDRHGRPHVVYGTWYMTSGGESDLRYAHLDAAGNWVTELLDASYDAGEFNSLRIDAQGYLHVAYFVGDGVDQEGEIWYARSKTPVGLLAGDLNCDGGVDAFDIDPFVLALTDPVAYAAQYPDCDARLADLSGDGKIDVFDIDPFVALLAGE